jgi:hypothetical protein
VILTVKKLNSQFGAFLVNRLGQIRQAFDMAIPVK